MFDFDEDGHLDIFQAVDFTENRLWMNRGELTFDEDALFRGCAINQSGEREGSMGVAAGGNIYVFLKIAATIGSNLIEVGCQMRGETVDEFLATRPVNEAR